MGLFSKKSEKKKADSPPVEDVYVLLDSNSRPCARGTRKPSPDGKSIFISLFDGEPAILARIGILQAVPQDKAKEPQMVRFIGARGAIVALEPMRGQGAAMRKNFRVPVFFESFIYPARGGRSIIRSIDLSCGGVAFRAPIALAVGELFEIVVPLAATEPLLLKAEILRVHLEPSGINMYACKFVDTIDDEESLLREAVFAIQINANKAKK